MKMQKKQNLALIPGGFECQTLTTHKENIAYIKNRKGFIKYAIHYGYKVHPMYIFGENKIFYNLESFQFLRLLLNKLKIIGILFWSRFGFMPESKAEIHSVVGKGIQMP